MMAGSKIINERLTQANFLILQHRVNPNYKKGVYLSNSITYFKWSDKRGFA